jgi:ribosome biogenesis protein ENP2
MKTKQRPTRQNGVVGEHEVSFMPASRSKKQKPEVQYDKTEFRAKERRSASGNTFRKM